MEHPPSALPEYENPPLVEVVFGIQFEEIQKLLLPYIGSFWEKIGKVEFPECQEMPPLPQTIEYEHPTPQQPTQKFKLFNKPPLPRIFFINKKQDELIQLQRDRFLRNWRKLDEGTEYPRYKDLFPRFKKGWEAFIDFVNNLNIGPVKVNQYELTYVNHITKGEAWSKLKDIENVFPDMLFTADNQFLPVPEEMTWNKVYRLPKGTSRLHVSMRQALNKETQEPILVLNLTSRGFMENGLDDWFNTAHEWIVRGFTDLTGSDIQNKVWRRIK